MARILILGGGFAGLITAEHLSKALGAGHQITLVSPRPQFTFYPALVRLAFGDCEPDDITFDLIERLKVLTVRFVTGEAVEIKANHKRVRVAGEDFNGELSYDYLVIALGRRLATEKIGGFFEHAHHLLGIRAALKFGEAVRTLTAGELVVGLAPEGRLPVPVCETAFALARKFKDQMQRREISVTVVFPNTIEEAFGGAELHHKLQKAFERHGIKLLTNFAVREVSENAVISIEDQKLPYDLLMLVPPFRGQAILRSLGVADERDFLMADEYMRVPHFAGVYTAGDIVDFSGPKLAHMAIRQARVAAENIAAEIKGGTPKQVYYHEIAAIIDQGGADTIYLHYGIWDKMPYNLKQGRFWSWAKEIHDGLWQAYHS